MVFIERSGKRMRDKFLFDEDKVLRLMMTGE
jgi:hypothetical protein